MSEAAGQQSSSEAAGATTGQAGSSQPASGSQSSQAGQTSPATTQGQAQQAAPSRPEYIPETHWDATAGKVRDDQALAAHFNQVFTRDAAEQVRRGALPQTADAYKAELPADFQVPEGVQYKFNDADPRLSQARALAHELGVGQEGFSKMLALYAGAQVETAGQVQAARNAEIAKLGATGPARVDALTTFYKATLGDAEGAQFMSRVLTASDVGIAEKLVAKLTGRGTFSQNGREPPPAQGRKSDAEIARMTPAERLNYSRQFNQGDMPAWKNPRVA